MKQIKKIEKISSKNLKIIKIKEKDLFKLNVISNNSNSIGHEKDRLTVS